MDHPFSSAMLQSSELDTIMHDDPPQNSNLSNGFINPEVLLAQPPNDLPDPVDSTDDSPRETSQTSSSSEVMAEKRQFFLPTGCCYDDRMKLHANADFSSSPAHPEDPRRIEAIMKEFKDGGLVYTGREQDLLAVLETSPTRWMWRIAARKATQAEICLAHTAAHFDWVRQLGEMSSAELRSLTKEFDNGRKSLYVGSLTYEAALISAGGAIETCKNVVAGQVKNAIAIIRPPGHHAEHNESMGFCIFNNVPIAAKVCMADFPETCRKVLILDWDVHHGNGIQNMFYDDPNVLYISLHVYQNGTFYPGQPDEEGLPDGGLDMCGAGQGQGRNINIGWHDQGMGDGEYMAAFQKIVMPIAQEFDPDLVIVSAGFDAAAGDELGGCWVTPACYSHMTHMLMSLASGKVAVCLEGGYNLKAISRSALAVAKTLMGEPPQRIVIPPINVEAARTIENVKRIQSQWWQCMKPGVVDLGDIQRRGTERASDVIRAAQRAALERRHMMVPLYVQRDKLSKTFENQVLATPNLWKATKILMIVHDPPEILAQPNPLDNTVLAHNAYVNDGLMPYIDWAISNGFGVVDVNFPQVGSSLTDSDPYAARASDMTLQQQTKDLLCYLWDNYLELNGAASLTLMGVGDAYTGIKQLLTSREIKFKIPSILSFVTGSLRPVKSETDPYLSTWYKTSSLIYVSPDHACWSDEDSARKVRKNRFGRVVMSEVKGLRAGLARYVDEGTRWMEESVAKWDERNGRGGGSGSGSEGDDIAAVHSAPAPVPAPAPSPAVNTTSTGIAGSRDAALEDGGMLTGEGLNRADEAGRVNEQMFGVNSGARI